MRWIIYGAGAIGGLLGALLVEHGEDVLLIARGAHAEAIQGDGLTVETPEGRRKVPMAVVTDPAAARVGADDAVLLAMKSQDTALALAALRQSAASSTPVACVQNGVENERAALRLFHNVYAVCVLCPAAHLEPGVVQGFSSPVPGLLDVGRYPAGCDLFASQLAAAFQTATFVSEARSDIMPWKYRKLLLNLTNAVDATCQPERREELVRRANEEANACLRAAGIDAVSAEEDAARRANYLQMRPVAGRPRGGGSSWQSLERRSGAIESDFLNGEIVLLGRQHGIPTPVNALLQQIAWEMARRGDPPGTMPTAEFWQRLDAQPDFAI